MSLESADTFDLQVPFRGTLAVAAGAVTADRLRGPGFRRLAHDVHVAAGAPLTLALFVEALRLWCPNGVVAGLAAAAAWCRADQVPAGEVGQFWWPGIGAIGPVELVVPRRTRAPAGSRVREDVVPVDEVVESAGLRLTGPARTVLDLLRFQPRDVAVCAADAMAARGHVTRSEVEELAERRPGSRGLVVARAVLPLVDRRSGNPAVSQMRLALHDHGVPRPVVDHVARHDGWPVALADLAWPELRCAVLCGERPLVPVSAAREVALTSTGWSVFRMAAPEHVELSGLAGAVFAVVAMLRSAARRAHAWR